MRDPRLSNPRLTTAGWALGFIVTGLVLWSPFLVFGYRNSSLHLALDSVDACVALLVAYLVYGRFTRNGRLQDLLLALGLTLLALSGLGLSYISEALSSAVPGTLGVWLPLSIRVMGALLVAAAALVSDTPARRITAVRPSLVLTGLLAGAVSVVTAVLWLARAELPVALDAGYVPSSGFGAIAAHPLLFSAQTLSAVCFFVASVAFTVQSIRHADELLRWLGPACALGGFARINYALFPSLYTDWLYTGDLLRTGCYVLFLIGATREMSQYWSAHARVAVLDDRRRLARELHDGVIQEVSFIRAETHSLPPGFAARATIIEACDRALDEARAAVQALGQAGDEPLGFVLHRAARELAERYRVNLEVDLDDSVDAEPDQKYALMRITREAVANAVRHGKAERVSVRLSQDGNHRNLTIRDDGQGFDVPATIADTNGFGLVSMRERARALPGSLRVEAWSGSGSVVTVTW